MAKSVQLAFFALAAICVAAGGAAIAAAESADDSEHRLADLTNDFLAVLQGRDEGVDADLPTEVLSEADAVRRAEPQLTQCQQCIASIARRVEKEIENGEFKCRDEDSSMCKFLKKHAKVLGGVLLAASNPFNYAIGFCIGRGICRDETRDEFVQMSAHALPPLTSPIKPSAQFGVDTVRMLYQAVEVVTEGMIPSENQEECAECIAALFKLDVKNKRPLRFVEEMCRSTLDDGLPQDATTGLFVFYEMCTALTGDPEVAFGFWVVAAAPVYAALGVCTAQEVC